MTDKELQKAIRLIKTAAGKTHEGDDGEMYFRYLSYDEIEEMLLGYLF